jgi:putative endonuclease
MAHVYILQGRSGRYYIGATKNLEQRLARHNSGFVHTTKRLGLPLQLIANQRVPSIQHAYALERQYKRWKNPSQVIHAMNLS